MLVGTVLVTLASLSFVGIVANMANQSRKAQTQSRALALQGEVVAALTRDDTFAGATQLGDMQKVSRADGGSTVKSVINGISVKNGAGKVIAVTGQRIGLDADFNPCDPSSADCPYRVDLALRCSAAAGCGAAYRVSIATKSTAIAAAALGAPLRASTVAVGTKEQSSGDQGRYTP